MDIVESSKMQVVHVTAAVGPRSFGLGAVVLGLVRAQQAGGVRADIWSTDGAPEIAFASEAAGLSPTSIHGFGIHGPERLGFSPEMEAAASRLSPGDVQVVHQHGLWTMQARAVERIRSRAKAAVVVAAQGSLQPWTLRQSRLKKWLASALYERRGLQAAGCLHATGSHEVDDYRRWGLKNPICVIPNGIDDAWLASEGDGRAFKEAWQLEQGQRIMLFLSRIARKKGLPLLLHALAELPAEMKEWVLVIAGADERGHLREIETLVDDLNLRHRVRIVGPLRGQPKRDAFAAADMFVLPSYSEGAPMVVLEALGAGVPVITTTGSPWSELKTHNCGWWVAPTVDEIQGALQDASRCTIAELQAMGGRGRALVSSSYTWRHAARMSVELYEWLRGARQRPDFVSIS